MGHTSLTLTDHKLLLNILLLLRLKPLPTPPTPPFPFTHLPLELQLHIISFLAPLDLYTLRLTSSLYLTLFRPPKLTDFLALEWEEWEKARPWPEDRPDGMSGLVNGRESGKVRAPREIRWMACCGCGRYKKVRDFGKGQRDAVVKRPGHALWSCRLCWGCEVGRWKS